MTRLVRRLLVFTLLLAATATAPALGARPASARAGPAPAHDLPVLAYYYIWFDPSSWNRAKSDLPVLGKYSSDDAKVLRQHVIWAKKAGIDGFIVSWKNTPVLDRRLSLLVDIAQAQHFSLSVIYQGLNFSRRPQPVERVAADFEYFAQTYANRAPFRFLPKPLIVWSGTWMYNAAEVARVTQPVRSRLTVLASEKNVAGYERIADFVDGDAYYWSSVDPESNHGYLGKLIDLSNAAHRRGGLWIAPAAPGFDARKVGGTTIVDRKNGATFERELATAKASAPDALGVISWNEFSENSHIEPSAKTGFRYLDVLASAMGKHTKFPAPADDSTDSSSPGNGARTGLIVAPVALAAAILASVVVVRRSRPDGGSARRRARKEGRQRHRAARARRRRRSGERESVTVS